MDKVFKIGLLVLGIIFLFLYSQKGRYEFRFEGRSMYVFDTSKGLLHLIDKDGKGVVADIISIAKTKTKK